MQRTPCHAHSAARLAALVVLGAAHFFCPHALARTPPQDPLPAVTLLVGQATLKAEVADEPGERETGLMGRPELSDGEAMLFVFPAPQAMSFWMHDTLVPLSVAYINAAGVIREIHDMKPLDETPASSAFRDLVYALEVPQGWFQKNNILPGDRVVGLPPPEAAKPD